MEERVSQHQPPISHFSQLVIEDQKGNGMKGRKWPVFLLGVILVGLIIISGVYFFLVNEQPTPQAQETVQVTQVTPTDVPAIALPTEPISTSTPVANFPPPLANVDFPTKEIEYPQDWPDKLRFPDEFKLVETVSGTLPESDTTSRGLKLRHNASPSESADSLASFFLDTGWQIINRSKLDSDGLLISIEKIDQNQLGFVVISLDVNNLEFSRIIITILQ